MRASGGVRGSVLCLDDRVGIKAHQRTAGMLSEGPCQVLLSPLSNSTSPASQSPEAGGGNRANNLQIPAWASALPDFETYANLEGSGIGHTQDRALPSTNRFVQPHFAGQLDRHLPYTLVNRLTTSDNSASNPPTTSSGFIATVPSNQAMLNGANGQFPRLNHCGNTSTGLGWQGEGLPGSDSIQGDNSGGGRRGGGGAQHPLAPLVNDRAIRRRRVRRPATRYTDIISDRNSRSHHFSHVPTNSRSAPMTRLHPFLPQSESTSLPAGGPSQATTVSLPIPLPSSTSVPASMLKGSVPQEMDLQIAGSVGMMNSESTPVPIPILSGVPIIPVGWKDDSGVDGIPMAEAMFGGGLVDDLDGEDLSDDGLPLSVTQAIAKIQLFAIKLGYVIRGSVDLEPLGSREAGKEDGNTETEEGRGEDTECLDENDNVIPYLKRTTSPVSGECSQGDKRQKKSNTGNDPIKFEDLESGDS
ncbi:hypothetical protein BSKO_00525 [Bryopsis sp. KO-2023]|nr:hypothetical protein BSKO_00525 [Bryopsis sp. KO-2023]